MNLHNEAIPIKLSINSLTFYETPKVQNTNRFIQNMRKRANENIKVNKSKQKLYIYEGKEVPGTEYINKNTIINQGNQFYKPSLINLQTPQYGSLNDNEIKSLTRYTHKGDIYINNFLKNKDNIDLYLYSLRAKFYEEFNFIVNTYNIPSYLNTIGIDTGCFQINKNDFIKNSVIMQPTNDQILQFIGFRCINFLFLKLLYNSLSKSPKNHIPFKVLRGAQCHYLSEDSSKIFYINSFLSTTMSYSVAENFGKLDKKMCRNYPETRIYNNDGQPTDVFEKDDKEYYNIYVFYVHPQCNYMSISGISEYAGEDEILVSPYSRYNFIKKEQYVYNKKITRSIAKEVVIRKYYYAILPTDLTIPNEFCEFISWRNDLITNPKEENAPKEQITQYESAPKKRKFFSGLFGKKGGTIKRIQKQKHRTLKRRIDQRLKDSIHSSNIRNKTKREEAMIKDLITHLG